MLIIWLKNFQAFNLTISYKCHTSAHKVSNNSVFQGKRTSTRKYCSSNNKSGKSSKLTNDSHVINAVSHDEKVLSDKIIKWAIQNNISYCAFSQLLKLLADFGLKGLPKNSRALLKARENEIKVSTVPPGTYIHFGLETNLKNLIVNLISKNVFRQNDINISIFIDNLPLSNITQRGLWVILGSLVGFTNIIFIVGAYQGYSRPINPNLFLSEFVEEAKSLCRRGLEINEVTYEVKIKRLICDAPAKAFVLNVKNFGGYSSCTKCTAVGTYKNKSVCFEEKCTPRTDDDFKKNEIYKNGKTNLLEIPNFGVVSSVPLDYMHLVCLGVVKKLLTIWFGDKKYWVCEKPAVEFFKSLAHVHPCEFQKKTKPLHLFTRWSANEFRQFLLYYAPVALKNNLKQEYYDHFLGLHVACRLLCMEASPENVDNGRELLNAFVKNYKNLYSGEQVTHNVHGLYHLADDCSSHGTLDSFSSFSFEKFLLRLRSSMKKSRKKSIPQMILKQSFDRVFARSLQKIKAHDFKPLKKLKENNSEQLKDFTRYERLVFKDGEIIPRAEGDSCVCLKNKKLIEVTDILEKKEESNKILMIAGKEFDSVSNFYSETFAGAFELGMFKAERLSDEVSLWPVDLIDRKCMKIPVENELVLVGLLDENF